MLHAFELGFTHPTTGAPLSFEAPMPEDMRSMVEKLSRSRAGSGARGEG
jgi:hypothetical protein